MEKVIIKEATAKDAQALIEYIGINVKRKVNKIERKYQWVI